MARGVRWAECSHRSILGACGGEDEPEQPGLCSCFWAAQNPGRAMEQAPHSLPAPCLPLAAAPAQGHPSGCCCCPGSSQPRANSRLLLFYTQRCAPVQTAEGTEAPRARQCLEMPSGQPAAEATAHTHPTSEPSPSRGVGVSPKGGDTKRGSVPLASQRRRATPGLAEGLGAGFHQHLVPPPWHRQEREALWGQNTRCWWPAEGCPSSFLPFAHHPHAAAA